MASRHQTNIQKIIDWPVVLCYYRQASQGVRPEALEPKLFYENVLRYAQE